MEEKAGATEGQTGGGRGAEGQTGGKPGELTEEDFDGLRAVTDLRARFSVDFHPYLLRSEVAARWSWFVITQEWLDSMGRLLEGKQVLEVCAGKGWLKPLMEARGVGWTCTDAKLGSTRFDRERPWVIRKRATAAVKEIPHDVVFGAWFPYTSQLDYRIARTGVPMVVVGEFRGCTGSDLLWSLNTDTLPDKVVDDFVDVSATTRPYSTGLVSANKGSGGGEQGAEPFVLCFELGDARFEQALLRRGGARRGALDQAVLVLGGVVFLLPRPDRAVALALPSLDLAAQLAQPTAPL